MAASERLPVVLVTGGTGYLGSLVVARLTERGVPTVSLDRRHVDIPLAGVEYVTADLRELDLVALLRGHEVDAVVHLAAIVEPPRGMADDELADLEVGGTQRVVDACVAAGVSHLTVTSSGAAHGISRATPGAC